ncbi:MAG: ATP-binding protein [Deltaproteobacteria bacterium]|nr:ATP-binding protein [Deltaproteobacteria bacterium]
MQQSFEFPADTAVLAKIGEATVAAGRSAGFTESEIGDIQLAVDEACTNTIMHGLKEDPSRTFQVVLRWASGEVEIFIRETGDPFDPTEVPQPDITAALEDRSVGGLGIYFIKQLMDEVKYRIDEKGMKTLYMVKRGAGCR